MAGNIGNTGDVKKFYFEGFEKDLSKLEKDLKPVDTSGVLGLGRKVVHQFNAGFEKLVRLIQGHGWISREQAVMKEMDKTVKDLTEFHQQIRIAYRSSNISAKNFEEFNRGVVDQLNKMVDIYDLARSKLGKKIRDKEIGNIEKDISILANNCERAIEDSKKERGRVAKKGQVTEPVKGVQKRLASALERKETINAAKSKLHGLVEGINQAVIEDDAVAKDSAKLNAMIAGAWPNDSEDLLEHLAMIKSLYNMVCAHTGQDSQVMKNFIDQVIEDLNLKEEA